MGSEGTHPLFLNPCSRRRQEIGFTYRPLCYLKKPHSNRRLGGPTRRLEPPLHVLPHHTIATIATELPQLLNIHKILDWTENHQPVYLYYTSAKYLLSHTKSFYTDINTAHTFVHPFLGAFA